MDDESHNRAFVAPPAFLPSSYMRSRHPDLFSDSSTKAEYSLTREMLSYHLETLTNLKDEIRFEEFARRLAERFISPNLRPQTGPTGGGDGKTDSETYPVSNALALRWFVPENAGAHERWAFAFSAKKDWRAKVRSDVKEIVGTKRGYNRVFFITNQFAPSRIASLAALPDSLERLGLLHARTALLFLAGQVDRLRTEGYFKPEETEENVIEFFEQWSVYGSCIELPEKPDYLIGSKVELKSRVVGSDVIVHSANNLLSLGIGEALLGALESLLATSLSARLVTLLDRIEIRIGPLPAHVGAPNIEFVEETGVTVGIVSHPDALTYRSREEAASFQTWLRDAVFEIFMRLASPSDPDHWAEKVLSSEDAFARSITFSNVPIMLESLFGTKTILSIFDWIDDRDESYEIKRTHSWEPRKAFNPGKHEPLKFGEGQPPEGLFDLEDTKHTDYRVVSPIDVRKWDAAKWRATVFQWMDAPDDPPPILGLAFVNNVPAARIFEAWHNRYGPVDENEQLRVAIIRGISVINPRAYAVLVGPGLDNFPAEAARTVGFVSRINKMYPSGPRNLESFLDRYRQHGRFLLAPFSFPSPDSTPDLMLELAIGKFRLVVREAWEIGENDPDFLALDLNDPPFIPSDVSNAPVIKTLERMVSWERKRGGAI